MTSANHSIIAYFVVVVSLLLTLCSYYPNNRERGREGEGGREGEIACNYNYYNVLITTNYYCIIIITVH